MGWLNVNSSTQLERTNASITFGKEDASMAEHVERIENKKSSHHANTSLSNEDLPFIAAHEVAAKKNSGEALWLVVDNVIYDCSSFVYEHPGGRSVIKSFRGEDCTWQFWTFHSKQHMQQSGKALRVGRTSGVPNRFKKRPKFVGLRSLGVEEDD